MASNWRYERFERMAHLVRNGVQPLDVQGLPYIALEHIGEGTLALTGFGVAEDATSTKSRFEKGDILFGKLRPYFRKVVRAPVDGICSTDIWVVRPQSGVDSGYLFYLMASDLFVEPVVRASEGTKMPRAKWEYAASLELPLPRLSEQRTIAHILGTLDDKIELNRRMNEALEAMVRALFKSWFVDFDPVRAKAERRDPGLPKPIADLFSDSFEDSELGDIPKGWIVGSILNHARLLSGGTPKTDRPEYWNGNVLWASAKDVSQCGQTFLINTERTITKKGLEESATQLIPALCAAVVARGATTGRMALFGREMAMNQTCYALASTTSAPFFLYCQLRQEIDTLVHAAHGSVFDTITTSTFANSKVVLPQRPVVEAFERMVSWLFQRILRNSEESETLTLLRDTLLPKLISGELRTNMEKVA